MLHDSDDYENPDDFVPERFIGEDGQIIQDAQDQVMAAFGFGRRYVTLSFHVEKHP